MHTQFEYDRPASKTELFELLDGFGEGAALYAGGTDLLVQIRALTRKPARLIDIKAIPDFQGIHEEDSWLVVGSTCSFHEIENSPCVQKWAKPLAEAASQVGSVQIRLKGTLGGNVQTASPAGDGLCALWGLEAELELLSGSGSRRLPVSSFVKGPGRTDLRPGEVISRFFIPKRDWSYSAFFKVGRRNALAIAVVSGILALEEKEDGSIGAVRICMGAVGPTPLRLREAEDYLLGKKVDSRVASEVSAIVQKGVQPISDVRAGKEYRAYISGIRVKRQLLAYATGKGI